jgi:hypothetical protein
MFIIKSIKRDLKTRPIYDCRYDERLEPKDDESTCVTYTGLIEELEYLKIETRLIDLSKSQTNFAFELVRESRAVVVEESTI